MFKRVLFFIIEDMNDIHIILPKRNKLTTQSKYSNEPVLPIRIVDGR